MAIATGTALVASAIISGLGLIHQVEQSSQQRKLQKRTDKKLQAQRLAEYQKEFSTRRKNERLRQSRLEAGQRAIDTKNQRQPSALAQGLFGAGNTSTGTF